MRCLPPTFSTITPAVRILYHKPILINFRHPKNIEVVVRNGLKENIIFGMIVVRRDSINIKKSYAHYVSVMEGERIAIRLSFYLIEV